MLALSMIVKDEARSIARTLASVRGLVDRWCILDTGSTDGTQDIVRESLAGLPGELHEEAFVDYATTRNRALDLCGLTSPFIVWLDADDVLEGGDALRAYLDAHAAQKGPDREAYYVRVETPGATFDSARVMDSRAGWRFVGAVHEVLTHPNRPPPAHRIPGVVIKHLADAPSEARSRARWERDVDLLERELARDPKASRAAFYLGMTLLWLGRNDAAIAALDRRVALGGWVEEVFYAKLSRARAADRASHPWPEVLSLYLDAYATAPHRAEPLFEIAAHYALQGNHALALLFARRAYELPLPTSDTLFVEDEVYTWRSADLVGTHAYWMGELVLGQQAARKAVAARPHDARLRRNLSYYESKE
jgi:glycosyltransferase involved in cell wall biosynthesis